MSGLTEMTDEDLFDEGNVDESDSEVDEDDVNEDDVNEDDGTEDDVDAVDINLQGGAKKKATKGEEESGEEEEEEEEEAGAGAELGTGAGAETSEAGSDNDSDADDEDYLQKFNKSMRDDLILNFHPESKSHNYEEIKQLAKVTRNKNGIVVDELHKTIPILTKYEKTRILGQRAKQIETGAISVIQVPPNIIDSYLIAKLELAQNKIPFIIRRPLPNGGMEYWYVSDLENL